MFTFICRQTNIFHTLMQLFKINPLKGLSGITIQEIYITFNAISNRILY